MDQMHHPYRCQYSGKKLSRNPMKKKVQLAINLELKTSLTALEKLFFRSENIQIFSFLVMSVWGRSKITTWKRKLLKNVICKINFGQVLAHLEKVFQLRKQRFFSSDLKKYTSFIDFAIASLGDIKRDNLKTKCFKKCFLQW